MPPYFSMIAIICLGVVGISGLYMAWLQLQSIGSLFDSVYGNILILKLCVITPMITLGAYHQIKLHYVMVQTAQRGSKSQEQFEIQSNFQVEFIVAFEDITREGYRLMAIDEGKAAGESYTGGTNSYYYFQKMEYIK